MLRLGEHLVRARSGHLPRALRGNEATHIVVDEAAYVPEALVTEIAMPMLATTDGALTLISTPHGKNHFWRFFHMGQSGQHGVWSRQAPSRESPYVSADFLALQRQLVSERAYAVEYGAQFADSQGRVFRSEAVHDCLIQELPKALAGPVCIGVDWARYGDYTAAVVLIGDRDSAHLAHIERFHGLGWSDAVRRVGALIRRYESPRVLCDATGLGDPVLEMLRTECHGAAIDGLVLTQGSKQEIVDGLAWLMERSALRMVSDPELMRELEHFEAVSTEHGGTRLAGAGGMHDDQVIGLALAARLLPQRYRDAITLIPRR